MRFKRLLAANYDELVSAECRGEVEEFLRATESVKHLEVGTVKRVTKIAAHIIDQFPGSLDDLLERIYQFNMEGAEMAKTSTEFRPDHMKVLRAHFYGHAGNIKMKLQKRTGELNHAETAYNCFMLAASVGDKVDPEHSAFSRGFAATAARIIFTETGNPMWGEREYKAGLASLNGNGKDEFNAVGYTRVAETARAMFELDILPLDERLEWARKSYDARMESGKVRVEAKDETAHHEYSKGADTASAVLELNIPIEIRVDFANKSYDGRIESGNLRIKINDENACYEFGLAGDICHAMFESEQLPMHERIEWAKKGYKVRIKAGELAEGTDDKFYAHVNGYAGDLAMAIAKQTRDKSWTRKALDCYNRFLVYYGEHPDPRMNGIIARIRESAAFIGGILRSSRSSGRYRR
ncbi:hypothetical protein KY361_05115 [Candidatus Woesearchaeota archaeon]|nr:hypothetical protein [Candidatus Woesearchaeota archaeon]